MKRLKKQAGANVARKIGSLSAASVSTVGGANSPPKTVGVISLSEGRQGVNGLGRVSEDQVRSFVLNLSASTPTTAGSNTFLVPQLKGHLQMLTPSDFVPNLAALPPNSPLPDSVYIPAALEMARVCDVVVFTFDGVCALMPPLSTNTATTQDITGEEYPNLVSTQGERALTALKAQGLPSTLGLLLLPDGTLNAQTVSKKNGGLTKGDRRKIDDLRRYVARFLKGEMGADVKVVEEDGLDSSASTTMPDAASARIAASTVAQILRVLVSSPPSPINFVGSSARNYMTVPSSAVIYDPATASLAIDGYLRGQGVLNVNSLIHVSNVGTFQMQQVLVKKNARTGEVATFNATAQEPLTRFATADALDGEQNLVGFDGDEDALAEFDDMDEPEEEKQIRPAGWSDYQSAWLEDADADELDDLAGGDAFDNGELSEQFNKKGGVTDGDGVIDVDMDDDGGISAAEREELERRRRSAKDEMEFPDEVQVEEGEQASARFQRYRSLKSFRQTYWDPKENLPDDYATLYHFSNFRATAKAVRADQREIIEEVTKKEDGEKEAGTEGEMDGDDDEMDAADEDDAEFKAIVASCAAPNKQTRLVLVGVSPEQYQMMQHRAFLSLTSLLPHENKCSVLHFNICQTLKCETTIDSGEDVPVKSKDVLTFQVGFRTWQARPIFSENNLNCDKHKFERFLRPGAFMACSAYGPVTYGPMPVMIWREPRPGQSERQLVAMGSVLAADADRTIVKRVVVTGYPVRVHKRHATVKYMFYSPEDVKWFKPAQLHTKHGLQGNIVESIGTHGAFKCLFNQPIKQHDTVCLSLYKRVYPKYCGEGEKDFVIL
jgi:pre-rRNA-processing protein TSR1